MFCSIDTVHLHYRELLVNIIEMLIAVARSNANGLSVPIANVIPKGRWAKKNAKKVAKCKLAI